MTDDCGTATDGYALFPFTGGYYTDGDDNVLAPDGALVQVVGTAVLYAKVVEGYVFPDGTRSREFVLTFTDAACP